MSGKERSACCVQVTDASSAGRWSVPFVLAILLEDEERKKLLEVGARQAREAPARRAPTGQNSKNVIRCGVVDGLSSLVSLPVPTFSSRPSSILLLVKWATHTMALDAPGRVREATLYFIAFSLGLSNSSVCVRSCFDETSVIDQWGHTYFSMKRKTSPMVVDGVPVIKWRRGGGPVLSRTIDQQAISQVTVVSWLTGCSISACGFGSSCLLLEHHSSARSSSCPDGLLLGRCRTLHRAADDPCSTA